MAQKTGVELQYDARQAMAEAEAFREKLEKLRKTFDEFAGSAKQAGKISDQMAGKFEAAGASIAKLGSELARGQVLWDAQYARLRKTGDELARTNMGLNAQRAIQMRASEETERSSVAWGGLIKKMVLWGIGAASAYRLWMKLRIAFTEALRDLFGNTEAWERLTAAQGRFGKALVLSLGSGEAWVRLLDKIVNAIEDVTQALVRNAAIRDALAELAERAKKDEELGLQFLIATGRAVGERNEQLTLQALAQERVAELMKEYNELLDQSADATSEAAKALEDYQKKLYQLAEQRLKALADAQENYERRRLEAIADYERELEDIEREGARRREELARDLTNKLADIEKDYFRKREELARRYNERLADIDADYARQIEQARQDLARRLEEIEIRFRERLRQIELRYSDEIYEAIAARDATAALRAMRQRRRQIEEAQRGREQERADAEADYRRRIQELQDNLNQQREEARRAYEEGLRELEEWLARQREETHIHYQQQMEDLETQMARQRDEAWLNLQQQLTDLKNHFDQRVKDINIQYSYERALAAIEYKYREDAYGAHLARMEAIRRFYGGEGRQYIPPPAIPGPPAYPKRARGGIDVVYGPTTFTVGEGGRPELVITQPLTYAPTATAPMPAQYTQPTVTGDIQHRVSGVVQAALSGYEGRLSAAISAAVYRAFEEVLR